MSDERKLYVIDEDIPLYQFTDTDNYIIPLGGRLDKQQLKELFESDQVKIRGRGSDRVAVTLGTDELALFSLGDNIRQNGRDLYITPGGVKHLKRHYDFD